MPTAPASPETPEKVATDEAPNTAEITPSGPSGHLPLKGGEDAAPTSPSPLRGGSIGEADRGGVAAEPDAPAEEAPRSAETVSAQAASEPVTEEPSAPVEETPSAAETIASEAQPTSDAGKAPRAAETTPSGPPGHLPLEGGEAPTPPSPLRGGSIGEADRGGVAAEPDAPAEEAPLPAGTVPTEAAPAPFVQESRAPVEEPPSIAETIAAEAQPTHDASEAPRAAETTPSGPSGHLPLKGGEDVSPTPAGKVTVAKKVQQKAEAKPVEAAPKLSWFQRLKQGLSRSSKELSSNIAGVFTKRKLDEDTLQDLEDVLIRADLGMETAIRVTDALASGRYGKNVSDDEVRAIMAEEMEKVLMPVAMPLELDLSHKPHVILVVGVNGTGKTTTIGKLAAKLVEGGLAVTLAAGDTFRAAAIEQLKIWGERTGSPVVSSKLGADAAGLAYDAFEKAKQAGSDVLIIDTAGRLQNKAELMAELEKIVRVLGKLDPDAPHTVLQTVDATTGQNALNQVEIFRNVAGVNGLVMTKLDGTARGGILVAIAAKHKLPVYFIGVGEQVDDLEPFSASDFAKAIAGVA
ncbi:signal recognition particle-docking protein FtsY [Mesorhizobium sp. L-8-3]|uniref:signal recognition particle-docking protein FtsY n=1 Tax=Mesorhizobium sp. L-8-3 TaxID=2744522 RepID=UPI00406C0E5A